MSGVSERAVVLVSIRIFTRPAVQSFCVGTNLSPNLRVENDRLLGCLPPNLTHSGTLFRPVHPRGKFKNATEIAEGHRFNSKYLLHAIELFY